MSIQSLLSDATLAIESGHFAKAEDRLTRARALAAGRGAIQQAMTIDTALLHVRSAKALTRGKPRLELVK